MNDTTRHEGPAELVESEAGPFAPKVVRLTPNPPPYTAPSRDEPGPEAMPPADTQGELQLIGDVGDPTGVPTLDGDQEGQEGDEE